MAKKTNTYDNNWSTERVDEYIYRISHGDTIQGRNPFFDGDVRFRKSKIAFTYTQEEYEILQKCIHPVNGIKYFANNFCYVKTPLGKKKIELRDYQEEILDAYINENRIVILSGRQSGKTIVAAIFMLYHLCFSTDYEILIAANVQDTSKQILKKIKDVMAELPFFMKPGMEQMSVYSMITANDNYVKGVSTSENSGIGFTGNLLYVDEFGRMEEKLADEFWTAVLPTLSANPYAKAIVTSTPKGPNHFYDLVKGAKNRENTNEFYAIEIPWQIVPRGMPAEEFREQEIKNLGKGNRATGIRKFNQEYACLFFENDHLLLSGDDLMHIMDNEMEFVNVPITVFQDKDIDIPELLWHPDFQDLIIDADDRFVITVDLSDGIGQNYTVFNIFKIMPLLLDEEIEKITYDDIYDFFGVKQVGVYRTNEKSIPEAAKVLETLVFDFFNPDQCKIVIEINFKGEVLINKLSANDNFEDDLLLHTEHSAKSKILQPGVKTNQDNKRYYCQELRRLVSERRFIFNEINTVAEMKGFAKNKTGSYSSDGGNDDIAMTCVIMVPFLESEWFDNMVDDILESMDTDDKKKLFDLIDQTSSNDSYFSSGDDDYKKLNEILN